MNIKRIIKHLFIGTWWVRRRFPASSLLKIKSAITHAEAQCAGQIRFAVEHALDGAALWAGQSARQRAIQVFSDLRVWDTEHNNGVLIYLLLADRDVEIVADRGIHEKLGQDVWESICQEMETAFRQGEFEAGVLAGIRSIALQLQQHYPPHGSQFNELPDHPVVM
ncbi:MAG: TPM domain-containing protein [Sideroxydans sp.]